MVQPKDVFVAAPRILTSYGALGAFGLGHPDLGASTAWPNANEGFKVRVWNPIAFTPTQAFTMNGATAAGNVDLGIYEPDSETLIGQLAAPIAQAGTNAPQFYAFTTPIPRGYVDLAMSCSLGTATLFAQTDTIVRALAATQMAAAHALPATWVPADPSDFAAILPLFGFIDRPY
jgi:hypothetical protein